MKNLFNIILNIMMMCVAFILIAFTKEGEDVETDNVVVNALVWASNKVNGTENKEYKTEKDYQSEIHKAFSVNRYSTSETNKHERDTIIRFLNVSPTTTPGYDFGPEIQKPKISNDKKETIKTIFKIALVAIIAIAIFTIFIVWIWTTSPLFEVFRS